MLEDTRALYNVLLVTFLKAEGVGVTCLSNIKGHSPVLYNYKYVTIAIAVLRSYTKFIPGTFGGTFKRFHPKALLLNEKKACISLVAYLTGRV